MKTEKDKMINGELYNPGCKELVKDRARARLLVRTFNDTSKAEDEKRLSLVKFNRRTYIHRIVISL